MTRVLTAAIAVILLAANFTVINAQQQQQQVQSDGGLTATLNSDGFTTGDTITVSGSVEQRGPGSNVAIEVINPQGETVKRGFPPVASDNTFSYSFVAGEQEEFDPNAPMVTSGNYSMVVRYFPPSDGVVIEEVELPFGYSAAATGVVEPEAAAVTTASQQAPIQNGTTTAAATTTTAAARTFQSTNDSFSVQVPQGWIIQDLNNTGSASLEESTRGYGLLAELCPQEEQQRAALSVNISSGTNSTSSNNSCQGAQEEIVHIVRYPDLETQIRPANNVTAYHLQKLGEVGYNITQIVNSTGMTVNVTNPLIKETVTTVPAIFVEIAYSTASAPNERREGYFILTYTNETAPNPGTSKAYSVFYEGSSKTNTTAATPEITRTSAASNSLAPISLPPAIGQVFDSFELIIAPEVAQQAAEEGESLPVTNATDANATDANATEITEAAETAGEGAGDDTDGDGDGGDGDGAGGDGDGGDGDGDGGDGDGGDGDGDGGDGDNGDGGDGDDDGAELGIAERVREQARGIAERVTSEIEN